MNCYCIQIYLNDGDKFCSDPLNRDEAKKMVDRMEENNEVFTILKSDDGGYYWDDIHKSEL